MTYEYDLLTNWKELSAHTITELTLVSNQMPMDLPRVYLAGRILRYSNNK